jgi:hypothetical protein
VSDDETTNNEPGEPEAGPERVEGAEQPPLPERLPWLDRVEEPEPKPMAHRYGGAIVAGVVLAVLAGSGYLAFRPSSLGTSQGETVPPASLDANLASPTLPAPRKSDAPRKSAADIRKNEPARPAPRVPKHPEPQPHRPITPIAQPSHAPARPAEPHKPAPAVQPNHRPAHPQKPAPRREERHASSVRHRHAKAVHASSALVQIGAFRSKVAAHRVAQAFAHRTGLRPALVAARVEGRLVYRVRVAGRAAERGCRGGASCFIVRR